MKLSISDTVPASVIENTKACCYDTIDQMIQKSMAAKLLKRSFATALKAAGDYENKLYVDSKTGRKISLIQNVGKPTIRIYNSGRPFVKNTKPNAAC